MRKHLLVQVAAFLLIGMGIHLIWTSFLPSAKDPIRGAVLVSKEAELRCTAGYFLIVLAGLVQIIGWITPRPTRGLQLICAATTALGGLAFLWLRP